jgi:hypothetical protein
VINSDKLELCAVVGPPTGCMELKICGIWHEVLKSTEFRRNDTDYQRHALKNEVTSLHGITHTK